MATGSKYPYHAVILLLRLIFNPINSALDGGRGGAHPDFIAALENFLDIYYIGEQTLEKIYVKVITCCHANPVFDTMFNQILTLLVIFSIN